jgi:3-hydroxymyristoyl/3-hydroxydecanoyl-(acyl carrier protein) dehydratase
MNFETSCLIPPDHPSLAGHFAGAPIVPGVVILDEVAGALVEWRKDCHLTAIPSVKFIAPISPGQPFAIAFICVEKSQNQIDFCCRIEGRVVVEGRLEIGCGACF